MCKFIINSREILNNFLNAKKQLSQNVKVCAVIKAQAYGFGANKICDLLKNRVDYFAVARLSEFMAICNNVDVPILILTPLLGKELDIAVKLGAEITISSHTNLQHIDKVAKNSGVIAKLHLKIDTGMNRYGIKQKNELISILNQLKTLKNVRLVGCYSHLFKARDKKITSKQLDKFMRFKSIILSYGFKPIFHLANSYGLKAKENQLDMVRLGYDLYVGSCSLHKFVAYVSEVKHVKKGETIGYNGHFKAKKDMTIAVCSAGYADGIMRALSKKGRVLINGEYAKIVGDICMDSFFADITGQNACEGNEVVIFGRSGDKSISISEVAKNCNTIAYEVLTGLSLRVKRIYRWR